MSTTHDNKKNLPPSEGDDGSPSSTRLPSRENSSSSAAVLAGLEGLLESSEACPITEVFMLNYRGSSEVDRHYTKAMLPWIIAEIKNQRKYDKVKVEISQGMVTVQSLASEAPLFSHSIKQIHKCVMEQADHTHFLYTLKPNLDTSAKQEAGSEGGPQKTPISTDHQCHLFKADSEEYVRNFFKCLRQQPRDAHQVFRSNSQLSMQSLPENFLHGETQFYEVLFVGRVKVSHCRVPASFIDEACAAFKRKQNARSANSSSSSEQVPQDVTDYQKAGSGHSVPNMTLSGEQALLRSNLRDQKGVKKPVSPLALPPPTLPPDTGPASAPTEDNGTQSDDEEAEDEEHPSFEQLIKRRYSEQLQGAEAQVSAKSLFTAFGRSSAAADAEPEKEDLPRQRLRTISGSSSGLKLARSQFSEMRERAGSFGSAMTRPRPMRLISDNELKVSGAEFNRSMLFHVGREELQLINPELKTVQLRKSFKDIPQRCQGILNNDHFGFICREVAGEMPVYVGYIFRCDNPEVTKDIVQSLNRAFEAVVSAHQREKQETSLCESCPMHWFSSLCAELEGLAANKAHALILRRVHQLPEADRELLLAKYEGAEAPEVQRKNNVLMMLLRAHMEALQQTHVHTRPVGASAGAKGVESSLHRVKKSLATSFQSMLKRDAVSSERECPAKPATPEQVRLENISDSPLGKSTTPHRPRSSTVSTAGGDTMRREFRARLQKPSTHGRGVLTANQEQTMGPPQGEKNLQADKSHPQNSVSESSGISSEAMPLIPKEKNDAKDYKLRSLSPEMEALKFSQPEDDALSQRREPVMMSKTVAKEVYGGAAQDEDEEKENIPENRPTRPKMSIFLKVGSPTSAMFGDRTASCDDDEDDNDEAKPTTPSSFRHVILQRVISPMKSEEGEQDENDSDEGADEVKPPQRRTWKQLQVVWRRAVFRQILLCRMEREIRARRELEEELELQRVCLSYDEEPLEEEALHTWRLVLSRPGARIDHCILKAGVRQGVPKALRGDIWHLLMVQPRPSLRLPVVPESFHQPYQHMIKGLTSQQHAILIDLGRTFPQHPYFTRTLGPGQLGLFNLLKAYSLLDREVGYCQGLSFVAGILLMHVNEETAYELLKHLMYVAGVRRQFRQDLDGLQVQMYQLSRLVHDKVVRVYEHFEKNEISPQLYAAPWFLTLFASTFPLHFVVRLYDLLFLEGLEAVFRISLVLLQEHEEEILACDGFEETMRYMKQDLPQVSLDNVSRLFDAAFELNLSDELSAYEVEYQVLREELCVTPQRQQQSVSKLRQERRALKRQNLDLAEQLQNTQAQKRALESSNQLLQQSQHHLEVRVRFLEVERGNLKQLVEQLWRSGVARDPDFASAVAPGLLRYLPCHSNSPQPFDRGELHKSNSENPSLRSASTSSMRTSESGRSPPEGGCIHVDAATLLGSNVSKSGNRLGSSALKTSSPERSAFSSRKSPSPDIGLFGSRATRSSSQQNTSQALPKTTVTSQSPSKTKGEGESLFPPFNIQSYFTRETADGAPTTSGHRPRSSTMDHGSMQRFVKGLTRNN